uniref:CSON000309 protein n=1 Tax=Culicoides sonorensis TaxID=179676 RepID=A0A336MJV2_CULSO
MSSSCSCLKFIKQKKIIVIFVLTLNFSQSRLVSCCVKSYGHAHLKPVSSNCLLLFVKSHLYVTRVTIHENKFKKRLEGVKMLQLEDESNIDKTTNGSCASLQMKDYKKFNEIQELCARCEKFYVEKSNPTEVEARFIAAFRETYSLVEEVFPLYQEIENFAHEYDYDAKHPGNGFRSFLFVVDRWAEHTLKIISYIDANKASIGFPVKRYQYLKEHEACNSVLVNLSNCLTLCITLRGWTDKGELFPNSKHTAKELLMKAHQIDQDAFYGRCLGFQFCKSLKPILNFITTSMAGFSKAFYYDGNIISKTTVSFYNSGKYYFDSEARARRIVLLSQNAGIDFCKSFWFLAENKFMYTLPVIAGTRVKINRVFQIPPEPLVAKIVKTGELVDIPVPSSHIGPGPVKARLISYVERVGMIGEQGNLIKNKFTSPLPPSDAIILHCHGGGFIACSSQSHEVYLREWTKDLNVPIISIDYSLAPRAPFPRALEEIFYAYCWILQNASLLGTTAKKIILAGDSAGANLNLGIALKCIQMGIRKPDGIFMAYCPTVVDFVPSPARLLCLMDPMLPFGFMMQCLKAYSSPSLKIIHENKKKVEIVNSIKYAGRTLPNSDENKENSMKNGTLNGKIEQNFGDDDEFVQEIKRKFATSDIVVHEHEDTMTFDLPEENVVVEEGKEICEENLNLRKRIGQIKTSLTSKMNQITNHKTNHENKTPRQKKILQDLDSFMEKSAKTNVPAPGSNDTKLFCYKMHLIRN